MKRLVPLLLSASLALSLLCGCSGSGPETTLIPPDPTEGVTASQPTDEPTLALPSEAPAVTHHPDPEGTHHPDPEETHHPDPEPTHHPEAEPSHHPDGDHQSAAAPAPTPKPTPEPTPEPTAAPAAGVDLAAFYEDVTDLYEFGFLQLADDVLLDGYYTGLTGIETEQCLVYMCMISMNNGEFGLVQVKDSADVAAVKAVFQARIDYMVGDGNGPGGAWYPGPTEMWENYSRVVSNGNYIMMVIHENCDEIVSQFNALF